MTMLSENTHQFQHEMNLAYQDRERPYLSPENVHKIVIPREARIGLTTLAQLDAEVRPFREQMSFNKRNDGRSRVLWVYTGRFSDAESKEVVIRHSNGYKQRLPVTDSYLSDEEIFDKYVAPYVAPEHQARALLLDFVPHTDTTMGLRDHPFTPGVREAYVMTTTYSMDFIFRGRHLPYGKRHVVKFKTHQERWRVQRRGRKFLLLAQGGKLYNISYGRLPGAFRTSHIMAQFDLILNELLLEGARAELPAGAYAQWMAICAPNGLVNPYQFGQALFLLQRPDLLNCTPLMQTVMFRCEKEYRQFLRKKPSFKQLLRETVGNVSGRARQHLKDSQVFQAIHSLKRGGLHNGDYLSRLAVMCDRPHLPTLPNGDPPVHFPLYTLWDDGQLFRRVMKTCVKLNIWLDTEFLKKHTLKSVLPKSPNGATGQKAKRPYQVTGHHSLWRTDWTFTPGLITLTKLTNCVMLLSDTLRMLERMPEHLMPNLEETDLKVLHDEAMRNERRASVPNEPIPSGQQPDLAHLDQVVGELRFERARTTHDLVNAGMALDNCVGGYTNSALNGTTIIVIAYDLLNNPQYCIEVLPEGGVRQYRANHNEAPRAAERPIAREYLKRAGLKLICSDLGDQLREELRNTYRPLPPVNGKMKNVQRDDQEFPDVQAVHQQMHAFQVLPF